MKTLKLILILFITFFALNVKSQNYWTGGDGSLNDISNWSSGTISSIDTLVFNSGVDVHVTVPSSLNFAGLRIENGTTVYFKSVSNFLISFDEVNIHNSTLNLDTFVNLTTQKSLEINSGILSINSDTLTINGDYYSSGGYIGGTENSKLIISGSNAGTNNINLNFDNDADSLYSITVDRTSDDIVNIGSNLFIKNKIDLINGKIRLTDNSILSSDSISIDIHTNPNNYIIAQPPAFIEIHLNAGFPIQLPIGTSTNYAPVSLVPLSDNIFSVNVHDSVYSEGDYGTPLINNNVNLCWEINPAFNTTYNLTLGWNPSNQIGNFVISDSHVSHFNGIEWNTLGPSSTATVSGYNYQTITISDLSGFFSVFAGTNNKPSASNNTIILAMNQVYVFNTDEFNYSDPDGDAFAKIMITQEPVNGNLFLDLNENNYPDNGEIISANTQILTHKILNGLLKYAPATDAIGTTESFLFAVSDGMNYSLPPNAVMTINVSSNRPPNALVEQIFTIPELSPQGTVVGKIDATDPDGDNVYFYPQEGVVYSDAFQLAEDGTITVDNSNLLKYSLRPSFNYNIDVCDDGIPVLCTPVEVTINLEQVTRDIEAANFISPNGDGHNDKWLVKGIKDDVFEAFIFNSSGKLLFYSSDYKNGWDGTSRGKELPPGVYYYLLKSPNEEYKGTITLVR